MRNRKRNAAREGGFTMIEVLFALAFLGFGLIAISAMFPLGSSKLTQARSRTRALSLAQAKAEELSNMGGDELVKEIGTSADSVAHYARTWVVTDSIPVPGSKQIDVTVAWVAPQGPQNARIRTYVHK